MRGAALALLVLAGCAETMPVEPIRPVSATGPLAVIVVPFDASRLPVEQRWIGEGIAQIVALGLAQLPDIVQIGRARLRAVSNPDVWTEEIVRATAHDVRADAALYGRVTRRDGRLVIEARMLDLRTGAAVSLATLIVSDLELLLSVAGVVPVRFARALQPAATEALSPRIAKAAYPTRSLRAFELFTRGRAAFDHGDPDEAVSSIARAIETDPQFVVAHYRLGVAHVALGNRWKAAAQMLASIQLDPLYPEAHKTLGDIFLAAPRGLFEQAIEAYSRAISLRPHYADAHVGLGDAKAAKGDQDGALAAYEKALIFDPFKAATYVKLGRIWAARSLCTEAAQAYERARKLEPASPDVRCGER